MNESIVRFLQQQTSATICLINEEGLPYCFNCFYAFNQDKHLLYFKSSADSYHSKFLKQNTAVAGTVLPDKLNGLLIKGVQFDGFMVTEDITLAEHSSLLYHKRHPLALAIKGIVYTIHLNRVKMTDGSRGFGKKITWSRSE